MPRYSDDYDDEGLDELLGDVEEFSTYTFDNDSFGDDFEEWDDIPFMDYDDIYDGSYEGEEDDDYG